MPSTKSALSASAGAAAMAATRGSAVSTAVKLARARAIIGHGDERPQVHPRNAEQVGRTEPGDGRSTRSTFSADRRCGAGGVRPAGVLRVARAVHRLRL